MLLETKSLRLDHTYPEVIRSAVLTPELYKCRPAGRLCPDRIVVDSGNLAVGQRCICILSGSS